MRNSYLIVTMACCREIFMPNSHGNCVSANTKAEAQILFDNIKELDEAEKQAQISNEEIIKNLR
jgi:hypothetical protein